MNGKQSVLLGVRELRSQDRACEAGYCRRRSQGEPDDHGNRNRRTPIPYG